MIADSQIGNPYRFASRQFDAATGLYYFRNRMYSPTLGRFLQRDPIWYEDGMNLYAYVQDDPVSKTDPYGLMDPTGIGDQQEAYGGVVDMTPRSDLEASFQIGMGWALGGMSAVVGGAAIEVAGPYIGAEAVCAGISNTNIVQDFGKGFVGGFLKGYAGEKTSLPPSSIAESVGGLIGQGVGEFTGEVETAINNLKNEHPKKK